MGKNDESAEAFLPSPSNETAEWETTRIKKHRWWERACSVRPFVLHILAFVLYSTIFMFVVFNKSGSRNGSATSLPLPGREALVWEQRRFKTALQDNPFAGPPRPELEDAWHSLMQNDNILLPHEVLENLELKTARMKDGSGDVASLASFHALHCLKKARQMTYKEHYHQGKSEQALKREQAHSDHCIEYIREYIMCKPDLSLVTFHFINNTAQHPDEPERRLPTTWDHSLHECSNWDTLNAWASKRRVNLWDYEQLEIPS